MATRVTRKIIATAKVVFPVHFKTHEAQKVEDARHYDKAGKALEGKAILSRSAHARTVLLEDADKRLAAAEKRRTRKAS